MRARRAARLFAPVAALALALIAPNAAAQTEAQDWAAIQSGATDAFAIFDSEVAAPVASRTQLRTRRFKAFNRLMWDTGRFIRTYIPEPERRSPRYAFALFTIALYAELSGDLWRAHDYYGDVCELSEGTLRPAGIAIPKYNGVSVLRLCIKQLNRLGDALRDLGPRPTHISLLFSTEEPGPEDFLRRFRQRSPNLVEEVLTKSLDANELTVLRALDSASDRDPCDDGCVAIEAARSLSEQRHLPFDIRVLPHVTVAGIAVEPDVLARVASAIETVSGTYARLRGKDYLGGRPGVWVISGNLAAADASLLETARDESPILHFALAPPATADRHIEVDDYPMIYGASLGRIAGYADPSIEITMLDYAGHGAFSAGNAAILIEAVMATAGPDRALPFHECPRVVMAARFCTLHRGMFARFLSTLPSRTDPHQTALQSAIAAGRSQNEGVTIGTITGLTTDALRDRFLDFVTRQGRESSPEPVPSETIVAELKRAFAPTPAP